MKFFHSINVSAPSDKARLCVCLGSRRLFIYKKNVSGVGAIAATPDCVYNRRAANHNHFRTLIHHGFYDA